jgi:hypothetical protein
MKIQNDIRGTILIWTVLLGVAMTSAFFFLATRMGSMGWITRDSMEYANQKAYLESYADYLTTNPSVMDGVEFDGITVDLTNEVDEITGVLDAGGTKTYSIDSDAIVIKWNKCGETGGLEIDQTIATQGAAQCGIGDIYDNFFTTNTITSIILTSLSSPLHYSIKSTTSDKKITSDTWHLNASIDLGYGKKIEVEREF